MDTFLPFFIRSFRNPHGWNLPDHAILTVLNTSGFLAWKPSYGDVEVAGFFVYIFFGIVRSHSFLSVTRRIIGRWKGLGERNLTVSRTKGSDQYSWRTCEVSLPPLVFTWKWVLVCGIVYNCIEVVEGVSFMRGKLRVFEFLIFSLYTCFATSVKTSSPLWIRTLTSQ